MTVMPSATITATSTPAPTATPVPTIRVDGLVVPDPNFSNPELFTHNNANSPIVQFANAFGINPAEVKFQNPQLISSKDEQQIVVLVTSDISSTKGVNESGIPLIVASKDVYDNWIWSSSSLKNMCAINGMKCGSTISGDENYQNPQYDALILQDFSILNTGGTSPQSVSNWGLRFEYDYSILAKENNISFKPGHLFDPGSHLPDLNTATKVQITEWMNQWVQDIVSGYPYFDSINFANEPVGIYGGSQYWVSDNNAWYWAYQEQWPVEAYGMIYRQLEAKGLEPGEDVHLILNLPYGARGGEWGYDPQLTIDFMKQIKSQIQAEIGAEAIMDVGIQFHLRDIPQSHDIWGGPDIRDLDEKTLIEFFNTLGQIGPVHITEFSVRNVEDPEVAMNGVDLVMSAAIQSGVVKDVVFWEALKDDDFLFGPQLQYNPDYYFLLQTLFTNFIK